MTTPLELIGVPEGHTLLLLSDLDLKVLHLALVRELATLTNRDDVFMQLGTIPAHAEKIDKKLVAALKVARKHRYPEEINY